jgi:hypothetical protein
MVARDTRPRSGGGTRVAARAGAETLALGVSGVGLKAARESSPSRVDLGTTAVLTEDAMTAMTGTNTVEVAPVTTHAPLGALDALRVDAAPVDFDALRGGDARGDVRTVSSSRRVSRGADDARSFGRRRRAGDATDVPHVRQTHNWDCGLACALMVLKALVARADADEKTNKHKHAATKALPPSHGARRADLSTLRRRCATMSVWTIDLAHLLRSFDVCDVALFTVTIGANPAFSKETFYKDSIKDDEARVSKLFAAAADAGILVEKRSVCLRNVKRWAASAEWILIVLVDKRALVFERDSGEYGGATNTVTRAHVSSTPCASKKTKHSKHSNETRSESFSTGAAILDRVFGNARDLRETSADVETELPSSRDENSKHSVRSTLDGYTGHYVVVCGYDESSDCFVVRDPAVPPLDANDASRKSFVAASALETARRAFGTDEDLLLVRRRRDR